MEQKNYDSNLEDIIKTYDAVIKVVDDEAREQSDRAYGGVVRSVKGQLQEYITHSLIIVAWKELKGEDDRIDINSKKIAIPIRKQYLLRIDDERVKSHIKENIDDYYYKLSVDKQVYIDDTLVMGIECKAYAENAMLKRIMVDFDLLRTVHTDVSCYLLQIESQLGGDYSNLNDVVYGSTASHTIMSYFDTKINILTLLKGERDINNPLHKRYKKLDMHILRKTKDVIKLDLEKYV